MGWKFCVLFAHSQLLMSYLSGGRFVVLSLEDDTVSETAEANNQFLDFSRAENLHQFCRSTRNTSKKT